MTFLERWFDIYPDGGSGALELLYLLAIAVGITYVRGAWARRRRQSAPANDRVS